VDQGRADGEGRVGREHRGQRLVLHLDERRGVLGGGATLGGDGHDRLADVAHAFDGQRQHRTRLHALVVQEHAAVGLTEPCNGDAGEHAGHAGRATRVNETDADEARVGVGAAHEGDVDHTRQR